MKPSSLSRLPMPIRHYTVPVGERYWKLFRRLPMPIRHYTVPILT